MSTLRRQQRDLDRVATGLRTQLERSAKFDETLDLDAAYATYWRVLELLGPQLPRLRVAAGLPARPPIMARWQVRFAGPYARTPVPSDRVFTYWNQPVDTAPPLVQACIAQIRRFYPHLRVLDGASARDLVDIPDRIATVVEQSRPAHFSDYLRTRLLAEHGGIWFDATVWLGSNLDAQLHRYLRSGTVFPSWTKRQIANWFIASHSRTPLITLQYLALQAWWDAYDDLPDYFLYHRVFEVLRALVPEVRGQWDSTPRLSSSAAHLLQLEMMQPWNPATVDAILTAAPLQKLSYKYDTVPPGSVLEHLLGTGPTGR
ncbi:capsular polysaccharide synthesis protein [Nocardia coubleae]|uniref:Capsular polysaccharide synthesis protein n=1 Tax=Nocardia coubleae TaxID=356147 RepID=A0A846W1A9_9NOCA|nr:capsular polysaccharide synthesis protein [Nocardia coubleae]NKX86544.1 hypothetical protein [Nocardia coubleae]